MQDARDKDEPIVELDHDHDDLTALLRDLSALTDKAASESEGTAALAKARDLLRYFQKDMETHFEREEAKLFPVLRAELPHRSDALDGLANAHETFAKLVTDIESALANADDPAKALRSSRATIAELNAHFAKHSVMECDLVDELDKAITEPTRRAELRERLGGF